MSDIFDFDDNHHGDRPRTLEKFYKGFTSTNKDILDDLIVTLVRLRGSWTTSKHQELMIDTQGGRLLRISRNNAGDTFQLDADESHGASMPNLATARPASLFMPCTARQLKKSFNKVRRQMTSYEHGDCHVFAQAIYKDVTGVDPMTGKVDVNKSIDKNDFEDDFM